MDLLIPPALFAIFLRTAGFALLLPGGYSVFPFTSRLGLAAALTLAISGIVGDPTPPAGVFSLLAEGLLGAAIALPFALMVQCYAMLGSLLDQARGQQLGGLYGAATELEGDEQIAKLLQFAVLCTLLANGLLIELVMLLTESFSAIPPGSVALPSGRTAQELFLFPWRVVLTAFGLFLPVGLLFVVCDLFIGLVSKLVPGLPVFAEMYVVKSTVLLVLLASALLPSLNVLPEELLAEAQRTVRVGFLSPDGR